MAAEKNKRQMSFRVTDALLRKVKMEALRHGTTVQALCTAAIVAHLAGIGQNVARDEA